jgi:hypothetical protein
MAKSIHEAATEVIKAEGRPLTIDEIFNGIQQRNLYQFNAKSPRGVVASAIRRRSGLAKNSTAVAVFRDVGGRRFDVC